MKRTAISTRSITAMSIHVVCSFFLCLMCLTACSKADSSSSSSVSSYCTGDSSRAVYFSETHPLTTLKPCVLYDVAVKKIFNGTYHQIVSEESLLAECEITHIFYQSPPSETNTEFAATGDTVFLWIGIAEYDLDTISSFRDFLESIDSAIIYGYQTTPHVAWNSLIRKQLEEEWGEDSVSYIYDNGHQVLELPPSIVVCGLKEWKIIPINNGVFDADSITSVFGSDMAFSFDSENPEGAQYFKDGDDVSKIYDALEKFVSEFD